MNLELWCDSQEEFGYIVDVTCTNKRVYLENHTLIVGVDAADIILLNDFYNKELLEKKKAFDIIEWLFEIGRGWFNIIPYCCRYINLDNYIVFNHNNNKFESLIDTYSKYAEQFIETYNEDGKPIVLGEYEFKMRIKLCINEDSKSLISRNSHEEEHIYQLFNTDNYLVIKSDLFTGVDKGLVISASMKDDYIDNITSQ